MPGSSASPRAAIPRSWWSRLFESGEHGNLAAPIVRDVIKAYFDKKLPRSSRLRCWRGLPRPPEDKPGRRSRRPGGRAGVGRHRALDHGSSYRTVRDLDWPLLLITLAICAAGVLQIYSATHDTIWQDAWWKQIVWVAGGVSAALDLYRRSTTTR